MEKEEYIRLINERYNGRLECEFSSDRKTVNFTDNVRVMCQKHGFFMTNAYELLNGVGCFDCFIEERRKEGEKLDNDDE